MTVLIDLLEFKLSPTHGIGGFARIDLPLGGRVIEYMGERIDKQEGLARCQRNNRCILYLDEQWNLDGGVEWNPARLLNHSCAPNCEAQLIDRHIWIVAIRAIAAGEEVTFNYNYDLADYTEHPCHCGSPDCVGFIVAEEFFDHVRAHYRTALRNIS